MGHFGLLPAIRKLRNTWDEYITLVHDMGAAVISAPIECALAAACRRMRQYVQSRIMRVIGLTGGICSGKSTIAQFLARMGAAVISADEIGHEAYRPHGETWQQVVDAFGKEILTDGEEIDRKKLGEIVFRDPEALKRLNSIMHPGMHRMAQRRIEELRRDGAAVVVLEAPLLVEAGWLDLVDEVWVAKASEANVLKRCAERSGLTESQARSRMASQLSPDEKAKYGDVVIDTDVSLPEVEAKVKQLWQERFGAGKQP
ncbi:MAG: dephospho-CoA kinase [Dehalococcoidia bacterium]|nr:dephospho-CoA kinase [Dehalococcoidia bacterium]